MRPSCALVSIAAQSNNKGEGVEARIRSVGYLVALLRPFEGLFEREGAFLAGEADFLGEVFFVDVRVDFFGDGERFPDLRALLGLLLLVLLLFALLGDLLGAFFDVVLLSERAGETEERALLARLVFFAEAFFADLDSSNGNLGTGDSPPACALGTGERDPGTGAGSWLRPRLRDEAGVSDAASVDFDFELRWDLNSSSTISASVMRLASRRATTSSDSIGAAPNT